MNGAADATAAVLGAWESIRGFFTPAMLFLVVNLVIGTIALTSRSHQRRRRGSYSHDDGDAHHHHHQEPLHQQENQYHDQQQHEQYVPPPAPAPLARTSSVLDRLRSIGLYRFRSGEFPPEYAAGTDSRDVIGPAAGDAHYARSRSEPAPAREKRRAAPSRMKKSNSEARKAEVAPAPARVVEAAVLEEEDVVDARADEFTDNFTPPPPAQQQEELYYQEEYVPPLRPAPLAGTSSVLDRLRSFSLYRFRSGDLAAAPADAQDHAAAAVAADEKTQAAHYSRSRSEPTREQNKKGKKQKQQQGAEAKMTKSSSEARKPAAAQEEAAVEEGVDARADNFINSFRQQLQLQRLNSLLNYKEMLNRGAK